MLLYEHGNQLEDYNAAQAVAFMVCLCFGLLIIVCGACYVFR